MALMQTYHWINTMDSLLGCLFIIFVIIVVLALNFGLVAGLVWIICWAFGFAFSWKVVIGVYAVLCLFEMVFAKINSGKE